ncbi:MAG: beta-galactosidase, partial [Verrucomicrobia bacterium]|nr:beta-galactosidase [Verrucomicrobiota bacterium]
MKHQDETGRMNRRDFLRRAAGASCLAGLFPTKALPGATPTGEAVVTQEPLYWAWWGWEPLAHYRRAGGIIGAVDTRSPTLEQWYDRLHSEDLARQMADLGINLAVTHFFKGFGLVAERAEQQRSARLVTFAHRHGIKVLGYCQSRSLYHEQFLAEEPRAAGWIQRDEKGQLRTWGGVKYRWAPCILSREFRDYMQRAIRVGLEDVGLDGLHFDNDYSQPCYCQRCEEGFRTWLAKRFPEPPKRFGRASFDDVRLPPTQSSPGRIDDPLVREWVRFRCESLAGYHAELCDYARRLRPNTILLGNPAYPRGPNSPYLRSVWPVHVGRHLDLMFAENGNFSGVEAGVLVSQVRAYKQAAAVGYRVISTVWRRNKLNASGLPESAGEIRLQVAEAAANGGIPGTNWALRPGGEGDRLRIDRPDLRDALAKSLRFVRGNAKLLAG